MKIRQYIALTWAAVALMVLPGCENEHTEPAARRSTLEVMPMSVSFLEAHPWTRGTYEEMLPYGYMPYNVLYPRTTPEHTTIGVFMTPETTSSVGNFIYQGIDDATGLPTNDWKSTITVTEGTQYYIYGFMPREDAETASITPLPEDTDGDFAEGAVLSIHNYNTLTAADVCVIVGVRLATEEEKINGPESEVRLGAFGYEGQEENENRLFVLLKHIYAGLHFKASIDPDYHRLRDIRMTKVKLTAVDIHPTGDQTVTLRANTTNTDPVASVTFEPVSASDDATITLYDDATGYLLPEEMPASFLSCFAPSECRTFILKTTYDVYDRKGNLIRKGCEAENVIGSSTLDNLSQIRAGELYTIELKVIPTYLYMLSEPDLNNPTIVVN